MTVLYFSDQPQTRHTAQRRPGVVRVDDTDVALRELPGGDLLASAGAATARVKAIAHGDAVYLHLHGRAFKVERADPTRSKAAAGAGAGSVHAPMPGVVVSCLVQEGAQVSQGEALLVIESMKLQMTITAPQTGVLADVPFAPGQTFARGAVLARVRSEGEGA